MAELLRESTPVARKAHRCNCCGAVAVRPGEKYLRSTYFFDGRVYDWISCTACREITGPVFDWVFYTEEGVGAESYYEWAIEMADDPIRGESARAYLRRARGEQ